MGETWRKQREIGCEDDLTCSYVRGIDLIWRRWSCSCDGSLFCSCDTATRNPQPATRNRCSVNPSCATLTRDMHQPRHYDFSFAMCIHRARAVDMIRHPPAVPQGRVQSTANWPLWFLLRTCAARVSSRPGFVVPRAKRTATPLSQRLRHANTTFVLAKERSAGVATRQYGVTARGRERTTVRFAQELH